MRSNASTCPPIHVQVHNRSVWYYSLSLPFFSSSSSIYIFPFLIILFAVFVDVLMCSFIYFFFKWRGMNFQQFIHSFVSAIIKITAYIDQTIIRECIVAYAILCVQSNGDNKRVARNWILCLLEFWNSHFKGGIVKKKIYEFSGSSLTFKSGFY